MKCFLTFISIVMLLLSCDDVNQVMKDSNSILAGEIGSNIDVLGLNKTFEPLEFDCNRYRTRDSIDVSGNGQADVMFDFRYQVPDFYGDCCPDTIIEDTTIIYDCFGDQIGYKFVKLIPINGSIEFAILDDILQLFEEDEMISNDLNWKGSESLYFEYIYWPASFISFWSNQTEKHIGFRVVNTYTTSYGWLKISTKRAQYEFIDVGISKE